MKSIQLIELTYNVAKKMDREDTHTRNTQRAEACNLGYPDEVLHHIGRMIPGGWKKLGVYLGIPLMRLDQMLKIKHPHEMALEMFQSWWSNTTPYARWGEFHYGLVSIHRNDLLKDSQKFFKTNNVDYNNPEQVKMERLFFTLAEGIPTSWKDLGIYLGVTTTKLAEIGQQPFQDTSQHTFQVLKMWQDLPLSSHHQLIRIMSDDMNRGDVVRYILKYFEKPRQGRTVCDCSNCD